MRVQTCLVKQNIQWCTVLLSLLRYGTVPFFYILERNETSSLYQQMERNETDILA